MAIPWAEFGAAVDENGDPVLNYQQLGAYYWHGYNQTYTHNFGYTNWAKTNHKGADYGVFPNEVVARDEAHLPYFEYLLDSLTGSFNVNKSFYEVGSGPGALVWYARQRGIEAYGVEISKYAVEYGETMFPGITDWTIMMDAVTWLDAQKNNAIDVLVSRGFLPCLDDTGTDDVRKQVNTFVNACDKKVQVAVHFILPVPAAGYTDKPIEAWRDDHDWTVGTYFVNGNTLDWVRKT